MRLGAYPCRLADARKFRADKHMARPISASATATVMSSIVKFEKTLDSQHGLQLTGQTPDGAYVEICEVAGHPWYLGCQFHPEFKSKPLEPHPLFSAFLGAALKHRANKPGVAPAAALVVKSDSMNVPVVLSDAR